MKAKKSILYFIIRSLVMPFYSILIKTNIEGEHFLPTSGPVIFVGNHISYIDPFVMEYVAHRRKRQVHFLAKAELFNNRIIGYFFKKCNQIPVNRNTDSASDSLKYAVRSLEHNHVVGIYPEATMPVDLIQLPVKSGAIRLAIESGAPIVVMGTWGAQDIWRKSHRPHLRFRMNHQVVLLPAYLISQDGDVDQEKKILAQKMQEATSIAKNKLGYKI